MHFRKLGRIFDPSGHRLPEGCIGFAQSPQAVLFPDFVRVYFSTRSQDPDRGKFRSQVAYADFTLDFQKIIAVSNRPVIALGGMGCFDEHGIFPFSPTPFDNKLLAYTSGWTRRVSVSVDTGIGLAISIDAGRSFSRVGDGPVLSATLHEPFLVGDPFVRIMGGVFHMWYIFGTAWKRYSPEEYPERTYKIGHATSADGVVWTKREGTRIVPDRIGHGEAQALPTVATIGDRHHMIFCYRESHNFRSSIRGSYKLGYAWSYDLENWVRDDESLRLDVAANDWDSEMQCYPHLFQMDGHTYLLYNGNQFGRHGFGAAILE